jgi:hypothetical protein
MSDDDELRGANNVTALQADRALEYSGFIPGPINPITGAPKWQREWLTRFQRREQIKEEAEHDHPPGKRAQWIKEQTELDDQLRSDPIVLRTGRISDAAWKRAHKIVENRFTNSGARLLEQINKLLEINHWELFKDYYEGRGETRFIVYDLSMAVGYIDSVLKDLTSEELQLVDEIAKALARLGKRAEGWSVRLSQSKRKGSVVQLVKGSSDERL